MRKHGVGAVERAHGEVHIVVEVSVQRDEDIVAATVGQPDVGSQLRSAFHTLVLPVNLTLVLYLAAVVLQLDIVGIGVVGVLSPAQRALQ